MQNICEDLFTLFPPISNYSPNPMLGRKYNKFQ